MNKDEFARKEWLKQRKAIKAMIVVALTGLCCWAAFIYLLIK